MFLWSEISWNYENDASMITLYVLMARWPFLYIFISWEKDYVFYLIYKAFKDIVEWIKMHAGTKNVKNLSLTDYVKNTKSLKICFF